jgi:hypothetical protein
MEWIEVVGQPSEAKYSIKKIEKFTLYDHNSVTQVNP